MIYCNACGQVLATGTLKSGFPSGVEFQSLVVIDGPSGPAAFHDTDVPQKDANGLIPVGTPAQREPGDDAAVRLTRLTGHSELYIRKLLLEG